MLFREVRKFEGVIGGAELGIIVKEFLFFMSFGLFMQFWHGVLFSFG